MTLSAFALLINAGYARALGILLRGEVVGGREEQPGRRASYWVSRASAEKFLEARRAAQEKSDSVSAALGA